MVKLIGGALSLTAFAAGMVVSRAPSLAESIARYRSWYKVNPKPIHMAPALAVLCSAPVRWHSGNNPHDPKFFTVYVNAAGKQAMMSGKNSVFPAGSVIVKEKLPSEQGAPELLTVMVKRERGFDSAHGDWQYFIANGRGQETSTDDVAKCQSCHEINKARDYVFRTYVNPKGRY
jgi:hypothetical protein